MIKETFHQLDPQKKATILKSSHEVFAEQGFDATTIRDIVKLSGISRGSFYQYFDDLGDVFEACVQDMAEKKMAYIQPWMDKIGQIPFIDLYESIMVSGIEFAYAFKEEALSIARVLKSNPPRIQAIYRAMKTEGLSMFKKLIEADQHSGFMSPYINTEVLARSLYGFNEHELMVWFEEGMAQSELIEAAKHYVNIIKEGIL